MFRILGPYSQFKQEFVDANVFKKPGEFLCRKHYVSA